MIPPRHRQTFETIRGKHLQLLLERRLGVRVCVCVCARCSTLTLMFIPLFISSYQQIFRSAASFRRLWFPFLFPWATLLNNAFPSLKATSWSSFDMKRRPVTPQRSARRRKTTNATGKLTLLSVFFSSPLSSSAKTVKAPPDKAGMFEHFSADLCCLSDVI